MKRDARSRVLPMKVFVTDVELERERRFYITSLDLPASLLRPIIRKHWTIQTSLATQATRASSFRIIRSLRIARCTRLVAVIGSSWAT